MSDLPILDLCLRLPIFHGVQVYHTSLLKNIMSTTHACFSSILLIGSNSNNSSTTDGVISNDAFVSYGNGVGISSGYDSPA